MTDYFTERILDSVNLASYAEYCGLELKKSNQNYVALCPFHQEKTPSFTIFPDNKFKCFGCGEYGNVFGFAMKIHGGISFPQAKLRLADYAGICVEKRYNISNYSKPKSIISNQKDTSNEIRKMFISVSVLEDIIGDLGFDNCEKWGLVNALNNLYQSYNILESNAK
jgi:DNA primase